jgi:hypothetical protein
MRRVFLISVLIGLVFGLDLRYPENNPGGGKGKEYGERARREYSGPKGESNPTRTKLMQPLTAPNQKVVGPGGYQFSVPAVMCGQGNVKDEKVFARVVVSDGSFTFSYASDPYSGVLDKAFSTGFTYLCAGGMCQNWDDASKRFTSCVKFRVINGQVITQPVDTLDGCVNPRNQGQLPSYFAGPLISELLEYYKSIGRPITTSKINQDTNGVAEYLGGKVENCQGQPKTPPQTQYLNNPYTMNDAALYYYFTCNPATDPTCRAAKKVMQQEKSSDIKTCVIERYFPTSGSTQPERICTPEQKLFPDGYNSTNTVCFSGDKFFNFSSSFWLECNPDGKGYTLKGWGYWEGAPCGSAGIYPPLPQVSFSYPIDRTVDWMQVGRLSVNKRTTDDLWSGQCVSDVQPMNVWLKNTYSGGNNVLEVKIDNAPACNYFKWSKVNKVINEQTGDCRDFDQNRCKIINEWWEDANGKRIQVIKNGNPVQQLSGCVEILRDEEYYKDWTSNYQTKQAPPQNCNWPPKTCKTIGTRTECRQWWRKIREYKCSQTTADNYNFDPVKNKTLKILSTLEWNLSTGQMSYLAEDCDRIERTNTIFICPATGRQYSSSSSCNSDCFEYITCQPNCPAGSVWNPSLKKCVANPSSYQCVIRSASCVVYDYYYPDCWWNEELFCWVQVSSFTIPMTCSSNSCSGTASWWRWRWWDWWWWGWDWWWGGWVYLTLQCYVDASSLYRYNLSIFGDPFLSGSRSFPQCTGGSQVFYLPVDWAIILTITLTADMYWQPVCPSGFTLSGSICVADPTCPPGATYDSSAGVCRNCRNPVQCTSQDIRIEKYVCNKLGQEYNDLQTCKQNCPSTSVRYIGTAGYDPECATGEKYCIIKKTVDGKVQFDTVQCNVSGSSWVCPADGGQIVEDCKCGKDLKMGLGYTAGMLEIIYSALKDRTCGP